MTATGLIAVTTTIIIGLCAVGTIGANHAMNHAMNHAKTGPTDTLVLGRLLAHRLVPLVIMTVLFRLQGDIGRIVMTIVSIGIAV